MIATREMDDIQSYGRKATDVHLSTLVRLGKRYDCVGKTQDELQREVMARMMSYV